MDAVYKRLKRLVAAGDADAAKLLATQALRRGEWSDLRAASTLLEAHASPAEVLHTDRRRTRFLALFRNNAIRMAVSRVFLNLARRYGPAASGVLEFGGLNIEGIVDEVRTFSLAASKGLRKKPAPYLLGLAAVFRDEHATELAHGYASWCVAWSRLSPEQLIEAKSERANTPPTEAQVSYLERLGWQLAPPSSKLEASRLINDLLNSTPATAAQRRALLDASVAQDEVEFMTRGEANKLLTKLMNGRLRGHSFFDGLETP